MSPQRAQDQVKLNEQLQVRHTFLYVMLVFIFTSTFSLSSLYKVAKLPH